MKFRFLAFFTAIVSTATVSAQVEGGSPDFDKLFDMYTMERYADCAWKALKFTESESHKKAPEPYLYYSMCLFNIWESGAQEDEEEPEFPKPYKNAMKYAYKFRKKDKDGSLFQQNTDFFDRLADIGSKEAHFYIDEGEYKKAAGEYKAVWYTTNKQNAHLQFMMGTCFAMARSAGEAKMNIKPALDSLRLWHADPNFEPYELTVPVFEEAAIIYSDYLVEQQMGDSARAMITTFTGWYPESQDLKTQRQKLGG